ncbi:MAG: DNA methyltransferase [Armatimonadetes bacterium]|nr:DNA methyltransferase [Armatimonadota bacterium]
MSDTDPSPAAETRRRANDLEGAEWTRFSLSVWNDIRKSADEMLLGHPALFPAVLVERVIRCFTREGARRVLDPFCGSGSSLLAAARLGGSGIGFEISEEYRELAQRRFAAAELPDSAWELHGESAGRIPVLLPPASVDLCVTSPPYWDILSQKRTADGRDTRDYAGGAAEEDLSRIREYKAFVEALGRILEGVRTVLKPGAYCVVNVMDLRKKARFYPLHSDLATRLTDPARGGGFLLDDLIVWDRRSEYNFLRPLGYPAVFRINKVHEYLLIFQNPREAGPAGGASG